MGDDGLRNLRTKEVKSVVYPVSPGPNTTHGPCVVSQPGQETKVPQGQIHPIRVSSVNRALPSPTLVSVVTPIPRVCRTSDIPGVPDPTQTEQEASWRSGIGPYLTYKSPTNTTY